MNRTLGCGWLVALLACAAPQASDDASPGTVADADADTGSDGSEVKDGAANDGPLPDAATPLLDAGASPDAGITTPLPDAGASPDASITATRFIDTSVYLRTVILNAAPGGVVLNGLDLGPLTVASIGSDDLAMLNSQAISSSGETMGEVDRQVLAYAYSCALPAASSMELEIGGETWEFNGALGLAPQWETGPCDTECQEWVSACVLARTNQFGIPVELSLRGEHAALAVPAQVAAEFTLREGSFYGNIFTPTDTVVDAAYACAGGRGSAIWELTDRFCSALGDGCPIDTVADCNINEFACDLSHPACSSYTACSGWNADGLPTTCHSESHLCGQTPTGTSYSHVITAYLRPPVPNCGNGICEEGEADSCAADCAGHWAKSYGSGCHEDSGGLSVNETTGNIALAGRFIGAIDFGGVVHTTSGDADQDLFVANLDPDGERIWSVSLNATGTQAMVRSVATDSSGNVIVAGHFSSTINLGDGDVTPGGFSFFVAKYSAATGAHLWSTVVETDKSIFDSRLSLLPNIRVAVDSADGVVIATDFTGTADLGLNGNNNPTASSQRDILVARFDSAEGLDWHTTLGGSSDDMVEALALDQSDNIIIGGRFLGNLSVGNTTLTAASAAYTDAFVAKLSNLGAPLWASQVSGTEGPNAVLDVVVAEDSSVLISGHFSGTVSLTGGSSLSSATNIASGLASADAFVSKLSSSGNVMWSTSFGGGRTDLGAQIDWDGASSYIVSAVVAAELGEVVNVEGAALDTGEYGDIVLVRYALDGTAQSVTQRGSPVTEEPKGLVATSTGAIVTGEFMGTLRFGGTYLTNTGGSWTRVQPGDVFLTLIDYLP